MSQSKGGTIQLDNSTFVQVHGDLVQVTNVTVADSTSKKQAKQVETKLQQLVSSLRTELRTCTEGTRIKICREITKWINEAAQAGQFAQTGEAQTPNILWINGAAGTGKTTLAGTIVRHCAEKQIPCAYFFAYHGDNDRSDPRRVLPAIAWGLASYHDGMKRHFSQSLQDYSKEIFDWEPSFQLEKLFTEPLRAIRQEGAPLPPSVVLIDALDECQRDNEAQPKEATIKLITAIAQNLRDLSPLSFIITCRPEQTFLDIFHQLETNNILEKMVLHDDRWNTSSDIKLYLSRSLKGCADGSDWPSDDDLAELVNFSENLFLIAETCIRFIKNPSGVGPKAALAELLENIRSTHTASIASFTSKSIVHPSNYSCIDHLYNIILARTPQAKFSEMRAKNFRMVLGTIVLLQIPLSAASIAKLLDLPDASYIRHELMPMHSVVIVPEDEVGDVKLLHQSFRDFIIDKTRCKPEFLLDDRGHHVFLAERCLDIWQDELREECHPEGDPTSPVDIVAQDKSHIRYAAQFWGEHLRKGSPVAGHRIYDQLLQLTSSVHAVYWIEFCARRGILRFTLSNIRSVLHFMEMQADGPANLELYNQLQRTGQWIRQYFELLEEFPSQVYHLPYAPQLILDPEELDEASKLSLVKELTLNRDPGLSEICQVEITLVESAKMCATFKRGEDEFILAGRDMQVWDMLSGVHVDTLEPRAFPAALAVSRDSKFAICGFENGTTKIWDLGKKVILVEAKKHNSPVRAIDAYGPADNCRVISGDDTGKVIIWNPKTGRATEPKVKYRDPVKLVAFSADGSFALAVWRNVEALHVWNVETRKEYVLPDVPEGVVSAAFSPIVDEKPILVCGTSNGLMHLWRDGVYEVDWPGKGEEIDGEIAAISFSPDGKRIASLLDIDEKESRIIVTGISDNFKKCIICPEEGVDTLVFSRDGRHVITAHSEDSMIHVWKKPTLNSPEASDARSSPINCVEISAQADMIFAGSRDGTFSLWSLQHEAGRRMPDFEGPLPGFSINCSAFSVDGKKLAIGLESPRLRGGLNRGAIYLIDITDHLKVQCKLRVLEVENPVYIVAFSPTNEQIIAYTADQLSVEIRDQGRPGNEVVSKLGGIHRKGARLHSFTFSPDGTKIATASGDPQCQIIVWDILTGGKLFPCNFPSRDNPDTVAFTSDGSGVVAMTRSQAVALFDAQNGGLITVIGGGALQTQKLGPQMPKTIPKLASTLWKFEEMNLLGRGAPQRHISESFYNCKVLTAWVADLDRNQSSQAQNRPTMIVADGWLRSIQTPQRILPIPEALHVDPSKGLAQRGRYVAFGSEEGQVHVLDITRLLEQTDSTF